MENARLIREGLEAAGLSVYGGRNAPYIWVKTPAGLDSWGFFDKLLNEAHVVGTPAPASGRAAGGGSRPPASGTGAPPKKPAPASRPRPTPGRRPGPPPPRRPLGRRPPRPSP